MMKFSTKVFLMCVALMFSAGESFALSPCNSDHKIGWTNCHGTHVWENGDKYVGEWMFDDLHGTGTLYFNNGDKYAGGWNKNKKEGLGTFTSLDGVVTKGVWADNKFVNEIKEVQPHPIAILQSTYEKLPNKNRLLIHSILARLGHYTKSIDGIYGKETAAALNRFNNENLAGANLSSKKNVDNLIAKVMSYKLKDLPKPKATEIPKVEKTADEKNETYEVASGTGFYVSDEGHIITNYHVIDGCTDMKVHTKGKTLETLKIAVDVPNDLALLKVPQNPHHTFALSTASPFPLQDIIVAGFPFGDRVSSTLKFTQGIVSSIAGIGNNYSEIQIDAALQPGNSGGPIMDEYGNIIAVAVAKLDVKTIIKDYGVLPENTNFGVKASAVRNLMEGNGIQFKEPDKNALSKQVLSGLATDGTVYLTCWMTIAQIEQLRVKKVFFESFRLP
jgi:S1-C subfamily serine protease